MEFLIVIIIFGAILLHRKKVLVEEASRNNSSRSRSSERTQNPSRPRSSERTQNSSRPRSSERTQNSSRVTPISDELQGISEMAFGESLWLAAGAAYSGGFVPSKGILIKKWAQKEINKLADNKSLVLKSIAKTVMKTPQETLMRLQNQEYSGSLARSSESLRKDVYGLIVSIISVDENLTKQELIYLKRVENILKLDLKIYEEVKDKFFFGLVVSSDVSDHEILTLLNVPDEWPNSRKNEYLEKEFILWNSRSQGGPPGRRKAAIQRLAMIGRARVLVQRG